VTRMKGPHHRLASIVRLAFSGPIARGTVGTTAILALRLVIQAGTLLVVTRMLGSTYFGAFSGVAALAVLVGTLATFGTHLVLLGEVSKNTARRGSVLPYALPTTLLSGSVLFVPYVLLAAEIAHHAASIPAVLALGVAELLLQPLIVLVGAEHQAHGRIVRSQLWLTLPLCLRLLAAIAVWLVHPQEPLTVYSVGYLLATGTALALAIGRLPAPWPSVRDWRLARRHELGNAAGYAILNLTTLGPTELDKTLAVALLPLGAAGIFAAGTRIVGAITLPVLAMLIAALPRLFRENGAQMESRSPLRRAIFWAALSYGLLAGSILWIAAPLLAFIFGPAYQGLSQVLPWLALAVPGMALRFAAGAVLVTQSRPWIRAAFEVIGLATLIVAALSMTPHRPAIGMPLAVVAAEWVMAFTGWSLVRRRLPAGLSKTAGER
jgi:O-antigen/teichoic acid export membrane protein